MTRRLSGPIVVLCVCASTAQLLYAQLSIQDVYVNAFPLSVDADGDGYYERVELHCVLYAQSVQGQVRGYTYKRNSSGIVSFAVTSDILGISLLGTHGLSSGVFHVLEQDVYDFSMEIRRVSDNALLAGLDFGVDADWVNVKMEPEMKGIRINSSPPGRRIRVDGADYDVPGDFTWAIGSEHSLSLNSPQFLGAATRYFFDSWSDGGAQNHAITVNEQTAEYTAFFSTEHLLTYASSPPAGGTITPTPAAVDNWYSNGAQISLQAAPNAGYSFSSWSGDASGTANPLALIMNGPRNVTANFTANRPPVVINPIADTTLNAGGAPFVRDLNAAPAVFNDPDGDALSYMASSSISSMAAASISGNTLTVAPLADGSTTITVTANDGKGGIVADTFAVVVETTVKKALHVSITGSDDNTGAASAPLRNISTALLRAAEGDTIKIAAGIYSEVIVPQAKVVLLGGYASGFSASARDIFANKTVLRAVNTTMLADTKGCTIDGFVFDGNNVAETAMDLNAAATASHNLITGIQKGVGYGADISAPVIFVNNTIDSCIRAIGVSGGQGASAVIKNNIVTNNSFGLTGILSNSVYRYNDFFKNTFNYAGGVPGIGDISLDPKFLDPAHGDYRVNNTSPTIDAGDPTDSFGGEPEPNGGRINMGAYGGTSSATSRLNAPVLAAPTDGAINLPLSPTLSWNASVGATSYRLQVATDVLFPDGRIVFDDSTITATSRQVSPLSSNTKYFWRVRAKNLFGNSNYSNVFSFTTTANPPTLISISPAEANRLETLEVVFTGTNFTGLDSVKVGTGIIVNSKNVNSTTQLTANITITAAAATGPRNFSVGASNSQTFTVNNPAPTLSDISPATGAIGQTVTVVFTGANFFSDATTINVGEGIIVDTIMVTSTTSLTANLTIAAGAAAGSRNFSVTNGGPGGGTSAAKTFTITNPAPVLTGINPTTGSIEQTLDVAFMGNNFFSGITTVNVGNDIIVNSVVFNSASSLTANITIGPAAALGPRSFSVTNSAPGGGTSAAQIFTVERQTVVLASIAPTSGNRLQNVDVVFTGAGFFSGITVNTGPGILVSNPTVISSTQLRATLEISAAAATGPRHLSVGTSNSIIFTVNNPAPTLTGISPAGGSVGQTVNVIFTGTNFLSDATTVNTADLTVNAMNVNSATSLTANVTIGSSITPGDRNFSVANSAPGGGISAAQTFRVNKGNNPPIVMRQIDNQRLRDVGATFMNDLNEVFDDPEGDALAFTAHSNAENIAAATVPSGGSLLTVTAVAPGTAAITLTADDGVNAAVTTAFLVTVNAAPIIAHNPFALHPKETSLTVAASIADDAGLETVQLQYRGGGEPVFIVINMDSTSGSNYQASIQANAVASRGVEYFIVAKDVDGAESRLPPTGIFSIPVQTSGEIKPTAQPGDSVATSYRLISVPLELDNTSAAALLEDDLGAYDKTKWRLYGLAANTRRDAGNKRPFVEFPSAGANAFVPGQSLFLIVKEAGKFIDAGSARSVKTDREYAIALQSGHNFVATPFNFTIPAAKLRLQSGGAVVLRTYDGGWKTADKMAAWEGYYIANNSTSPDTFLLNPDLSAGLSALKNAGNSAMWRIQILARCGKANDAENYAGLSFAAEDGWDEADLAEPPTIGDFVALYFEHAEWQKVFHRYSDDMRSAANPNQRWHFAVESNLNHEIVQLQFDGISQLDPALAVYLVDEEMNFKQNLRERAVYEYQSRGLDKPKRLNLVVGKDEYVSAETENTAGIPHDFVLEQNFPNPFNPETAIRFGLPVKSVVALKIYDLSGREIAIVLENVELPAGRHQRVWDGLDNEGKTVGSGIYFYRLRAGGAVRTGKMTMLR